jgi:PIN domain nuclease of toxin-antitoxin system
MELLLDTCAALWWWSGDDDLSSGAAAALRDPANGVVLHQASLLEITLKYSLGKLPLADAPSLLVPKAVAAYGIRYATLSDRDIAILETLPLHHRDPFDRLLVAHALDTGLTIVTPDARIAHYGARVLW